MTSGQKRPKFTHLIHMMNIGAFSSQKYGWDPKRHNCVAAQRSRTDWAPAEKERHILPFPFLRKILKLIRYLLKITYRLFFFIVSEFPKSEHTRRGF